MAKDSERGALELAVDVIEDFPLGNKELHKAIVERLLVVVHGRCDRSVDSVVLFSVLCGDDLPP